MIDLDGEASPRGESPQYSCTRDALSMIVSFGLHSFSHGAADWAKGLVNHLICITHCQWKYRNDVNNYKVEGQTPAQHKEICETIDGCRPTDPPPKIQASV
jgi:hypothetical protein